MSFIFISKSWNPSVSFEAILNHKIMNSLVSTFGGKFVGIFQAVLDMHKSYHEEYRFETYDIFIKFALEKHDSSFDFLDFSNIFDSYYSKVPFRRKEDELTKDTIFIDHCHTADAGNKIVAIALLTYLKK